MMCHYYHHGKQNNVKNCWQIIVLLSCTIVLFFCTTATSVDAFLPRSTPPIPASTRSSSSRDDIMPFSLILHRGWNQQLWSSSSSSSSVSVLKNPTEPLPKRRRRKRRCSTLLFLADDDADDNNNNDDDDGDEDDGSIPPPQVISVGQPLDAEFQQVSFESLNAESSSSSSSDSDEMVTSSSNNNNNDTTTNDGDDDTVFEEEELPLPLPTKEGRSTELTIPEVQNLFTLWNTALATLDPDVVAKRYSSTPVFLPTITDDPRTDYDDIQEYYMNFLKLQPQVTILESSVTTGEIWAKDAGIYEISMASTGATVKAKYSFVYVLEDGEWKIAHHHSSIIIPEEEEEEEKEEETTTTNVAEEEEEEGETETITTNVAEEEEEEEETETTNVPAITEEEVKDLFYQWNKALATLDADAVTLRYAKRPVLLPTVSDGPLTDYDTIKDYFETLFLPLKPQGEIIESHAECGTDWCKDVGIYEFTMGSDGSKVRARYTFIYVFEDGEWKISHHHSSAMPEDLLNAVEKLREVEKILGRKDF